VARTLVVTRTRKKEAKSNLSFNLELLAPKELEGALGQFVDFLLNTNICL
jgi:hypothetical protein